MVGFCTPHSSFSAAKWSGSWARDRGFGALARQGRLDVEGGHGVVRDQRVVRRFALPFAPSSHCP